MAQGEHRERLPWRCALRKGHDAVFAFLHSQSLVVIENGSTFLCLPSVPIFRRALN